MIDIKAQPIGKKQIIDEEGSNRVWLIMINGSCEEQGSGADVVVHKPEGVEISYALKFEFKATNNQTEYKAFITGLKLAHAL